MLGNPGTYANKKRKKPVLKQKKNPGVKDVAKSNPSKRHRDRLNAELDRLLDLLPFSQDVRSGLDKLSVLRLSVGYLKVKSHFTASINSTTNHNSAGFSEGELLLQALNGFVLVVSTDGLVFYVSPTITEYLGFSQTDVLHQSVFHLIHTDDRQTLRQKLRPQELQSEGSQGSDGSVTFDPEQLLSENSTKSFVCRFRCLLDNSSGFLALKLTGRHRFLQGVTGPAGRSALFMVASPVQPPSIVEIRAKLLLYQTKHQLDFTPVGIDDRGSSILGYSEEDFHTKGSGYQFIHAADMMYCADSHIRMIKTGETGLLVFRLLSKSQSWLWVKSNGKVIYKAGRPDFIIAYQKALTNAEGEAYLRQRRLELPFTTATGEGVLYNTGATVDVAHLQFYKRSGDDMREDVAPGSLLDCFLSQDGAIYSQTVDTHLPLDQIFQDSRALVSVPGGPWEEAAGERVKEEPREAEGEAMDGLEAGDGAMLELEAALRRLGQESLPPGNADILDFIDSILFKPSGAFGAALHLSCLAGLQDVPAEAPPPCGLQLEDIFSLAIELPELLPPEDTPPNNQQATPLSYLQTTPLNHLQTTPQNNQQATPLNYFQATPLNPFQIMPPAPPLNNLQTPPLTYSQAPPLQPFQPWRCPPDSGPALVPCQDFGSSNVPRPASNPPQWLPNGHTAPLRPHNLPLTPHSGRGPFGEHFSSCPAGDELDPSQSSLQGSHYCQWK